MGAFKEIYEDYLYVGDVEDSSMESEGFVDKFSELLPGFEQALAFERPQGTLRYNPFEEVATPIKPLSCSSFLL